VTSSLASDRLGPHHYINVVGIVVNLLSSEGQKASR
jgi:hypothetical protein